MIIYIHKLYIHRTHYICKHAPGARREEKNYFVDNDKVDFFFFFIIKLKNMMYNNISLLHSHGDIIITNLTNE